MTRIGPIGPDRTLPRSDCPIAGGAKSLFPCCFPGQVDQLDRSDRDCRAVVPRLRPDGAKWTDWTGEDSAPVRFAVVPNPCFHSVFLAKWTDWTDRTGIAGWRCLDRAPEWRKVDRSDRRGQRPGPVAGGAKSLFPYCFLGKWTDWTDRTGITVGCSVRTAASCISWRQPHDAAATRHAAADRDSSAFTVSTMSKTRSTELQKRTARSRLQ
jgi:hypothetical protein